MKKYEKILLSTSVCLAVVLLIVISGVFRYEQVDKVQGTSNKGLLFASVEVNSTHPVTFDEVILNNNYTAMSVKLKYPCLLEHPNTDQMKEYSWYSGTGISATVNVHDDSKWGHYITLGDLWETTDIVSSMGNYKLILLTGEIHQIQIEIEGAWTEELHYKSSDWSSYLISSGWDTHTLNAEGIVEIKLYTEEAISTITRTTYNNCPVALDLPKIESQYVVINMTGWTNQVNVPDFAKQMGITSYSSNYHLPGFQKGTITLGYLS